MTTDGSPTVEPVADAGLDATPDPARDRAARQKRLAFVGYLVFSSFTGAVILGDGEVQDRTQDVGLVLGLLDGLLLALWCRFDGEVRGKEASKLGLAMVLLFTFVAFPVYCLWSRGLKGFWLVVGFFLASTLTMVVGGLVRTLLS